MEQWPADRRTMAPEAVAAVLARNSVASVIQQFDNGRVRTRRSRYAYTADALYLPAFGHPRWFRREPQAVLECHVSELHGLEVWSYVWVRGYATQLLPSDDSVDNEAWQIGAVHLSRVLRSFGRGVDAFSSYGIIRVDIATLDGAMLSLA